MFIARSFPQRLMESEKCAKLDLLAPCQVIVAVMYIPTTLHSGLP
jgi:hypothetical protein